MDAGDVRGGGRGELRSELGNDAIGGKGLEDGVLLGVALEKAPAKSVHEEEDHRIVARGQIAEDIERQRWLALAGEQPLDGGGQVGEAIGVVARLDEMLRKGRGIDGTD